MQPRKPGKGGKPDQKGTGGSHTSPPDEATGTAGGWVMRGTRASPSSQTWTSRQPCCLPEEAPRNLILSPWQQQLHPFSRYPFQSSDFSSGSKLGAAGGKERRRNVKAQPPPASPGMHVRWAGESQAGSMEVE